MITQLQVDVKIVQIVQSAVVPAASVSQVCSQSLVDGDQSILTVSSRCSAGSADSVKMAVNVFNTSVTNENLSRFQKYNLI